jgi:methionyl-tRNA formyltransferase
MRIVFMGTGPVSAASLSRVIDDGHELPLVISRPDRRRGRRGRPAPPEVKVVALDHGLEVHQPDRVREEETVARLRSIAPEAIVVVAYNQLLPAEILAIPPHGCLNVHLSLLPSFRGAAPVQHAILSGETATGATVMRMAEKFDTGPILRQEEVAIEPDETSGELTARLAVRGAELLGQVLRDLGSIPMEGVPQDPSRASRAPLLRKEHGAVDWTRPASTIHDHIRGMTPWPSAFTFLTGAGESPERLILLGSRICPSPEPTAAPGLVLEASGDDLIVAAAEGTALRLVRLKRANSKALEVRAFLNGCPIEKGDRLEPQGG